MYEDTRINSLEVKEERRMRDLTKARERYHKLEGIRLAYEEKKRIRREMRLQRKHQKKQFEHGVITLQSAYRGSKDRERYEAIVGEKRQKDFAVTALQSAWRGQQDRKVASERKHTVVGAAKKIQKKYTSRLYLKEGQVLLARLREERDLRDLEALRQYQEECATMLQSFFRGTQGRVRHKKLMKRHRRKRNKVLNAERKMRAQMQRGSYRRTSGVSRSPSRGASRNRQRSPKKNGKKTPSSPKRRKRRNSAQLKK